MSLVLFLLYEITLGKDSYWYHFLRMMPTVKFTCFWTQEEIDSAWSPALKNRLKKYKESVVKEWYRFKKVLRKYPLVIPDQFVDKELFYNLYGQASTRCFGYGLPSTMMVPMADNINHSSVSVSHEVMNTDKHLEDY